MSFEAIISIQILSGCGMAGWRDTKAARDGWRQPATAAADTALILAIGRRLLYGACLLVGVSLVAFLTLRALPGDFAEVLLTYQMDGEIPSATALAEFRSENGFDAPILLQYLRWASGAVTGDLGVSFRSGDPVVDELQFAAKATLWLTGVAFAVVLLAIPLGIVAALNAGGWIDRLVSGLAVLGMAIPNFWHALLFMLLFGLVLGWLPSSGYGTWGHVVLPALVIATSSLGVVARIVRSSLIEQRRALYVRTARSKGTGSVRVLVDHCMLNAAAPVLTILGLQTARIFDGAIVVETVFGWPGLGRALAEAVLNRDFPMIQGTILLIGSAYVLINLLVDIAIALIDPRVRASV